MPATLTLSGKKFVVLSEGEYRILKKKADKASGRATPSSKRVTAQDTGDIAESKRRLKDPRRISAADVFNQLGV